MITLLLTEAEANDLAALIDVAVKAGGIKLAAHAVPLFAKLETAVKQPAQNKDAEQ